ncbi:TPA: HNH endonuclease [Mannheimia haemolytica]
MVKNKTANDDFKFPSKKKAIMGRISTITNAFVQDIIPTILPTEEEKKDFLETLKIENTKQCVYCGGVATTWDHFRPLVRNKKPTGYINEISNMVPACSTCNSSKGNNDWKSWLNSETKDSLIKRGFNRDYLDKLKDKLNEYENKFQPRNISEMLEEIWNDECEKIRTRVINEMKKAHDEMRIQLIKLEDKLK